MFRLEKAKVDKLGILFFFEHTNLLLLVEAQMVIVGTLRTLNSRVLGSNPIVCRIYSFNGIFPGLGLLHMGCDLSHNLLLLNLGHLHKSVVFTGWFLEMKSKLKYVYEVEGVFFQV